MMLKYFLIGVGGAVGSVLRYAMQGWVQRAVQTTFPAGTLVVNVLGCLVIGVLAGFFAGPHLVREEYRLGIMVGVVGGFTTFSAFGVETFHLANERQVGHALLNIGLSCGLGLFAVWVGYRLAERWFGA
jgi:CrcB protein